MKSEFTSPASLLIDRNVEVRAFGYKNYSVKTHDHEFYEMNIVLEGTGIHKIEDTSVNIKTGDVFVIPPFIGHSYENTGGLEVYHILYSQKIIDQKREEATNVPGFIQLVEIEPYVRQHFSNAYFLHLSYSQLAEIKCEFPFIEDKGIFDKKELLPLKYNTAFKILYYLSYLLSQQIHEETKDKESDSDTILKLLEYIHLNFDEKITVEHLCKISLLSRSSLFRSFYKICECSPMEYVNKYRCKKVLDMLKNKSLSKTEIAHRCGFYDLSHMERTIKNLL